MTSITININCPESAGHPSKGIFGVGDIASVIVHIHTTEDDKDKEISFQFDIRNGAQVLGSITVGDGELWDNGDNREYSIPITPFPYANRASLTIWQIYHNTSGNQGWEGAIWASAVVTGAGVYEVRSSTGNFKLGESGNPKDRSFNFDR